MGGRKVITMCLFNRPAYTRQVLEALRACDGIGDYLILPHVEPGDDEVRALVEGIDFAECLPTFNRKRLGVNLNTENALLDGFSFGDFSIHVEDDIVLAPDALRYYEWCGARYAADPSVFSVTSYHRRAEPAPPDAWHRVRLRAWFHPWGWATWRDRWGLFSGRLHTCPFSWDLLLNLMFCAYGRTPCCHEAYPELARSQNIGRVSSDAAGPADERWFLRYRHLAHWAGGLDLPPGEFHEEDQPA